MRRALVPLAALLAALAVSVAAAAADGVRITPIGRLPFPERGFVVDLPPGVGVAPDAVSVRENGRAVRDVEVSPLGSAGIHFGAVLAIDASESMTGEPLRAALAAAQAFVARRAPGQQVGLVAFDGSVRVLQAPTAAAAQLERALSHPPQVGYGTRIYDALDRSLRLLAAARLSTATVVLLSDGADVGSREPIDAVIAKARAQHVRVFTVGLHSSAFRSDALRRVAASTGGAFVDATSTARLQPVYAALGQRLASEYVVRYRSSAPPRSSVRVAVGIGGVGTAATRYTAPSLAGLAPYHRSLASRLLLSPLAMVVLSLLAAAAVALVVVALLWPRGDTIVSRVQDFTARPVSDERRRPRRRAPRLRIEGAWFERLEHDLEIARIGMPALRVVELTAAATLLAALLLALVSPIFIVLALLAPLVARTLVARQVGQVRNAFADQLPPNLQVLASALRVGHSFVGALTVVVENAHEPSHGELQRVLADERLGVPLEEAVRRVAVRMASRDLEQVALLAELQRTAGGNSAEVLDTVVETLRERADLRRLVRTLTAQGRMARWILTALPVAVGLAMLTFQADLMRPLVHSGGGQVALLVATAMVIAGSLVIQKIVDIEV